MTISQIRSRVNAHKRRFARELAIVKALHVALDITDHWQRSQPPDNHYVFKCFADAGIRSDAWLNLAEYLDKNRRREEIPYPDDMVRVLLRYAWDHRYDDLLDYENLPRKPHGCSNLPAWV